MSETENFREVSINRIDPPALADRLEIDPEEVKTLAQNIGAIGLLQPLVIRPVEERFEVVAGHRRFLAVKSLRWKVVMCHVREMTDLECALARACENIDRLDISPIEEALVYKNLVDNFRLTVDQVAGRMKKSAGIVKRRLDLLKMAECLQRAVHQKQIVYGVAEEFARLHDVGRIEYFLGYAIDHGITVSVARSWVNDEKKRVRLEGRDVGGTGGGGSPLMEAPTYVSCETCQGAVDVREAVMIRCCPDCVQAIKKAINA